MNKQSSPSLKWLLLAMAWVVAALVPTSGAGANWSVYMNKPAEWFQSQEGRRIVSNVLSWQSPTGSWPKNTNTTAAIYNGSRNDLQGTFDNGATTGELRFLAAAFRAMGNPACREAVVKGIDHILKAQYPTGGWPQSYPPGPQYHRHITFNDNAMVRLMEFIHEVAASSGFEFVGPECRKAAKAAFDRGIGCILKCQVTVNGRLTAWCAQHDEIDYRPRSGRAYELASLSGAESAAILELLMSLEQPGPEVARAIHAGAAWYAASALKGIRIAKVNGNKVIVQDPMAPPLWARFYEIETNRPFFCGRDAVKHYDIAEIEAERRNGYAWHGPWGDRVAARYERWAKTLPTPHPGR